MPFFEIIQFDANSFLGPDTPTTYNEKIQKVIRGINELNPRPEFVLGTQHQNENTIQITVEYPANEPILDSSPLLKTIGTLYGAPFNTFRVNLEQPVLGPAGLASANVVEFVLSYFPISRITPEFQKQVQGDFLKFDEVYSPAATGSRGWASGWLEGEQPHENFNGELTKCFLVVRGWDSMKYFETSVKSEAYGKAIPLLLAWNAPWKMVSLSFAL